MDLPPVKLFKLVYSRNSRSSAGALCSGVFLRGRRSRGYGAKDEKDMRTFHPSRIRRPTNYDNGPQALQRSLLVEFDGWHRPSLTLRNGVHVRDARRSWTCGHLTRSGLIGENAQIAGLCLIPAETEVPL